MRVNTGELAGYLYNSLQGQRVRVYRVRYFGAGCWQLCVMSRGGLIRGVPVIEYDGLTHSVTVAVRSLFGRRASTSFVIREDDTLEATMVRICALVMERLH